MRSFRSNNQKKWKELSDKIVSLPVRRLRTVRTWRSSTNPAKREEHNLSALSVSEFSHNRLYIVGSNTRGEDDCAAAVGRFFFCKVWGPFGLQSLWTGLQTPGLCRGFFRVSKVKQTLVATSNIPLPQNTKETKEGKERVFGWVVVWVVCKKGWPFFQ